MFNPVDPVVFKQISTYVHHFACSAPEREAVVFGSRRITYRELSLKITAFAKGLIAAGVKKGDRVVTIGCSTPDYWLTFLASTEIGAIWCGLNPKYQYREWQYVINDARPRLLIVLDAYANDNVPEKLQQLRDGSDYQFTTLSLSQALQCDIAFEDFLLAGQSIIQSQLVHCQNQVEALDPALIVYTSGSTGDPKGAMLSHYGLGFGGVIMGRQHQVAIPRVVCSFPINHVACVSDICCTTLVAGGTLFFLEQFSAEDVLRLMQEEPINVWAGVPTMFKLTLDVAQQRIGKLQNIKLILWGGAAMPRDLLLSLNTLGAQMLSVYGLTESTCNTLYSAADTDIDTLTEVMGQAIPEVRCRIVKADGNICATEEEGELQFLSAANMLGYYNRPEQSQQAFTDDGWLRTGDICLRRNDGNIVFISRIKEMFKSGGINIYPREIERVLEEHPAIEMAAVVGVPDKLYQEVGYAFVSVKQHQCVDDEQLQVFARQHLVGHKVPKRIFIVAQLPMLPVGKIDKVFLKKQAVAQMGIG